MTQLEEVNVKFNSDELAAQSDTRSYIEEKTRKYSESNGWSGEAFVDDRGDLLVRFSRPYVPTKPVQGASRSRLGKIRLRKVAA